MENKSTGILSGFASLDELTSGWKNSQLTIIGYRKDYEKNAFLCSFVRNIAVVNKTCAGIFCLDMSNEQLINRLIENVSHVSVSKMHEGCLTQDEWSSIANAVNVLKETPLYTDDDVSSDDTILRLDDKVTKLVKEKGIKIIFVDGLQHIRSDRGLFSATWEDNFLLVTEDLRLLAETLDIPIVAFLNVGPLLESEPDNKVWQSLSSQYANYVCSISSDPIQGNPHSCSVSYEVQNVMTSELPFNINLILNKDIGVITDACGHCGYSKFGSGGISK